MPFSQGGRFRQKEKVLLPHANPKDQQRRIAASATLRIGNEDMKVYSVHTETIWLSEDKRREQVKALVEHIAAQQSLRTSLLAAILTRSGKKM